MWIITTSDSNIEVAIAAIMSAAVAGALSARRKSNEKEKEKTEVLRWLSEYDETKNGMLNRQSFSRLLSDIDEEHECTNVALDFCLNGRISINYIQEWKIIPELVNRYQQFHLQKDTFLKYDTNQLGYLDEKALSSFLTDIVGKTITEADAKIAIFTCSEKDSAIRNGEQPLFVNGLHDGVEIQRAVDMFKTIKQKEQQRLNNTNLLEVPNGNGSKCCIVQ